ncbi:MAG TPA: response regulator [Chitinophagales bacterium]|nr:response regulator [Chitinophagales bacterium]
MEDRRCILVVDDDEMTRDLIAFSLRAVGYEVITVDDGLHAVLKIRERKPDLAILDVMLPDLSGLELLNIIRAEFMMREMPVILMSRLGNEKLIIAADKLGAASYLVKPFEMEQLIEKISCLPGFQLQEHNSSRQ